MSTKSSPRFTIQQRENMAFNLVRFMKHHHLYVEELTQRASFANNSTIKHVISPSTAKFEPSRSTIDRITRALHLPAGVSLTHSPAIFAEICHLDCPTTPDLFPPEESAAKPGSANLPICESANIPLPTPEEAETLQILLASDFQEIEKTSAQANKIAASHIANSNKPTNPPTAYKYNNVVEVRRAMNKIYFYSATIKNLLELIEDRFPEEIYNFIMKTLLEIDILSE